MRLVLSTDDGPRDVVVDVNRPGATVADLLAALDVTADTIEVGPRHVPADHALDEAGLHDGATVRLGLGSAPPAPPATPPHGGPWLVCTGGLDAGRWWALRPGRLRLGRAGAGDVVLDSPTVSGRHAELEVAPSGRVAVADLGSTNGTWIDDTPVRAATELRPGQQLRLGAVLLEVVASRPDDRPADADRTAGTWVFNRPPRPALPAPPTPLVAPGLPRDVAPASGPGWASLLTPIVMAGAMVVVFDNPMFALFAAISPLTVLGSWWESRRRARAEQQREDERTRFEHDRFRAELGTALTDEVRRRGEFAPDLAEVVRRVTQPSVRLWERRTDHADAFTVLVGHGDVPFRPLLRDDTPPSDDVRALLDEHGTLRRTAVPLDLARGGVVGVVGPRPAAVAVARSLVMQLAVHHGPADLGAALLLADDHAADWAWAAWLPHTSLPHDRSRDAIHVGPRDVDEAARSWLAASDAATSEHASSTRLVVVDAPGATEGRAAPVRAVLNGAAGPVVGVVVAPTADRLPAVCRYVVTMDDEVGTATVRAPAAGTAFAGVLASGVGPATAREVAVALARFQDAEVVDPAAALPSHVALPDVLGDLPFDPDAMLRRWQSAPADPGLPLPLGAGPDGPLWLDLVVDGPHALVGGTTGSGKSELLRSLVVGLATQVDPAHCNIVLIDYKGGSAFDACAELPHTVGVVTDLDEHLGARALRCLEAELHHRESVLRAAGASDLPAYLRTSAPHDEPLPRLLVVIDEFATVAAELPDFLDALVGIAQRGRSLGVHLVLATQRPSGVVSENIRANTNLRIALRVQDATDGTDVVGVPDPARIARDLPGRAYVRLGPGEVVPVQTALATGRSGARPAAVSIRPLTVGEHARAGPSRDRPSSDEAAPTDLERLVAAAREAARRGGYAPPRTPWPNPLPERVDLAALRELDEPRSEAVATVALLDEPDRQRQVATGWDLDAGNLLVFGIPGSGTTTTLASIALALSAAHAPDDLHVYVLDADRGQLRPLAGLPHVGDVVTVDQHERRARLLRLLAGEVERRRAAPRVEDPRIVLLVDGYGTFASLHDDPAGTEILDLLGRVIADGPGVRVHVAATANRAGEVPGAVLGAVAQRWVHRLADPYDLATFGISPRDVPELPPGRVVLADRGGLAQVATASSSGDGATAPEVDLATAVATIAEATRPPRRSPRPIAVLPRRVAPTDLPPLTHHGPTWEVPLGLAGDTVEPLCVRLHPGEHLLIAGPPRSGRSGVLAAIGVLADQAGVDVAVLASPRSPLVTGSHRVLDVTEAGSLGERGVPSLLLVDDAELVADADGVLARLAKDGRCPVRLVVAGRSDELRSAYGHWTSDVRRSRTGVLLQPDVDLDGDLLGLRLPRRAPVEARPGAGWLVHAGVARFAQAVQAG